MQNLLRDVTYYGRLLKELVFPRRCAVCGDGIEAGYVCEKCRKNYLLQKQLPCAAREEFLAGQAEPLATDVLQSIFLLYKYDGVYMQALHEVKFNGNGSLLPFLREEAEAALPGAKLRWLQQFDVVTCVPTSPERLQKRGFDVPQEIFGALLDQRSNCVYSDAVLERVRSTAPLFELSSNCVYSDAVLERVRSTAPLFELKPEQRRQELAGCFALRKHFSVRGKRILLCDDIFTTGSTLTEAARVLLQAEARSVSALAFCAARENWEK